MHHGVTGCVIYISSNNEHTEKKDRESKIVLLFKLDLAMQLKKS